MKTLQRYSAGQRSNHWATVLCFVLAGGVGLAIRRARRRTATPAG